VIPRWAAAAGVLALAAVVDARAQVPDSLARQLPILLRSSGGPLRIVSGMPGTPGRTLVFSMTAPPLLSQYPVPPLTRPEMNQISEARQLAADGLYARALAELDTLLAAHPHHAQILTERARVQLASGEFAAVERLARTERTRARDSLLLATEAIQALEKLGKPREGAAIALEAWTADPAQDWADATLQRLGKADPRGVREQVRATLKRVPERDDIAIAAARLDWQLGDSRAASATLAAADQPGDAGSLRWRFAQTLLSQRSARDSTGAAEALLDLAADTRFPPDVRLAAGRRAWEVMSARGAEGEAASRITRALKDIPPARWDGAFLMDIARALRVAGQTDEARALLGAGQVKVGRSALEAEQALADLRDGPPERALPALKAAAPGSSDAAFRYAEALFFAGQPDSALPWYQKVSELPAHPNAGASLERIYLIEDAMPRAALPAFGRVAYETWRGDPRRAGALADSLYRTMSRGPLWAQAAMQLAALRVTLGDPRGALEPLLAVADSLPDDRMAPLARQRAGDLYAGRLKDPKSAVAQYEECLARYPRAWNAAEVRRRLEQLRRDHRL
jgi:thioredoxin-like negative regulator of GroEL